MQRIPELVLVLHRDPAIELDLQQQNLKLHQQIVKGNQALQDLQTQQAGVTLQNALRQQAGHEQIAQLLQSGASMEDPDTRGKVLGIMLRSGMGGDQIIPMMQNYSMQQALQKAMQGWGGGAAPTAAVETTGAAATPGALAPTAPVTATAPGADPLSPAFQQKVQDISQRLGMNPNDLMSIMHFETGGTFNPAEPNRAGSGATGLIQFTPRTAQNMGTTTQALAGMTREQQLDMVEKYLTPYKGKMGNLQDAYMAVLNPSAIGKSPDTVMWQQGTPEYTQNAGLDIGRKGYITVGDATATMRNHVEATQALAAAPRAQAAPGAVAPPGSPAAATIAGIPTGMQIPANPQLAQQMRNVEAQAQLVDQHIALIDRALPSFFGTPYAQQMEAVKNGLLTQRQGLREQYQDLYHRSPEYQNYQLQQRSVQQVQQTLQAPAADAQIANANRGIRAAGGTEKDMLPPGTSVQQLREAMQKWGTSGKELLPEPASTKLREYDQEIQLLHDAESATDPNAVGPISGPLERLKQLTGLDVSDQRTRQSAIMAYITNAIGHQEFGARLTAVELGRLRRALPDQNDPAPVFAEKMRTAIAIYQDTANRARYDYEQQGFQVPAPYQPGRQIVGKSPAERSRDLDKLEQAIK